MDGKISAHVVVDDAGMTGHGHLTTLALWWDRDDPLAVKIALAAEPDHPALPRGQWAVLREFLRYGLEEATGDGAVRICPSGPDQVALELQGARPYVVHAPAHVLRDFLDATEVIVPTGTEADEALMDALIERLLEY